MVDPMVDPFSLRQTRGPTVVHIEPEEVAAAVDSVLPAEAQALVQEAQRMWRTDELSADVFERSARYALGLEQVVRAREVDALAHFDQGLLAVVPSWGESRLIAQGIPVVAEADLNTATGMLILNGLAGESSFVENYGFNFDQGAAYIAHDSMGNPNLAASDRPVALRHSVYYRGVHGWGAALEFAYRPGPVTMLSLVPSTLRASGCRPKCSSLIRSSMPKGGWSRYILISSRITFFSMMMKASETANRPTSAGISGTPS